MDATKFSNRIVSIWNSLSENVVSAPSVTAFKGILHSKLALGFFLAGLKVYIILTCLSQVSRS